MPAPNANPEHRSFPIYFTEELPEAQWAGAQHISSQIYDAAGYVRDFVAALGLFDYALARIRVLTRQLEALEGMPGIRVADKRQRLRLRLRQMESWQVIAARDGAINVYHFFMNLSGIDEQLRLDCPDLLSLLPRSPFKTISKIRKEHFEDYSKLRHAIGHTAELRSSRKQWKRNALEGFAMFNHNVNGRKFETSIEGRVVGFEMSKETLRQLRTVLTELYGAFDEASRVLEKRHYDRVFSRRE